MVKAPIRRGAGGARPGPLLAVLLLVAGNAPLRAEAHAVLWKPFACTEHPTTAHMGHAAPASGPDR